MASRPLISVIVLAHNKVHYTRACFGSILSAKLPGEIEVILVDNASTDETRHIEADYPHWAALKVLRNSENLSFSIANNIAANQASGKYILLLNNDVVVGQDAIFEMWKALEEHGNPAVVGAKLLWPGGKTIQHAGISQMLWGLASNYGVGAKAGDMRFCEKRETFAVTGAMLLAGRDDYLRIGGLDERYSWGYEDVDFCLKARDEGMKVLYIPDAVSEHHESATLKTWRVAGAMEANYAVYRKLWGANLDRLESLYMESLRSRRIRRIKILGAGSAGKNLKTVLTRNGFEVIGFVSFNENEWGSVIDGLPVAQANASDCAGVDAVMAGTQFFFQLESMLKEVGILDKTLFPELPLE